jgi:hypothetical protein
MIVQWCMKGMSLPSDEEARAIIDTRMGILSNWWREVHEITPATRRDKLTAGNLDLHVNHFSDNDPVTGQPFSKMTPYISFSSGTVERDSAAKTNYVHTALQTALWFGTNFGSSNTAYLYTCWVIVAIRAAVEVEAVAEEVRDLNSYRRYSAYQTEGEVVAKVFVPDNHIQQCQKWTWNRASRTISPDWIQKNPRFTRPDTLSNVRELILYGASTPANVATRPGSGRNRG